MTITWDDLFTSHMSDEALAEATGMSTTQAGASLLDSDSAPTHTR